MAALLLGRFEKPEGALLVPAAVPHTAFIADPLPIRIDALRGTAGQHLALAVIAVEIAAALGVMLPAGGATAQHHHDQEENQFFHGEHLSVNGLEQDDETRQTPSETNIFATLNQDFSCQFLLDSPWVIVRITPVS